MEPMKPMKPMERMEPIAASRWWPEELGAPDSSGSQDGWRYAYFSQRHVLAVERGGHVNRCREPSSVERATDRPRGHRCLSVHANSGCATDA